MEYIERSDDSYRVRGTRVSLESVVLAFLNGQTPESIAQSFPTLSLEQVYGAITYYLGHRTEIDAYLTRCKNDSQEKRQSARDRDPMFYQRLADARRSSRIKQS